MLTNKTLLIDADRIVYAVGFACEKRKYLVGGQEFNNKKDLKAYLSDHPDITPEMVGERLDVDPINNCLHSVKIMLDNLCAISSGTHHIFIGGNGNFRLDIDPQYKANRIDNQKPVYYHDIRAYMQKYWGAEVVDGMEADDICAMLQTEDTVIVSGDKDLLQVEGWHYNTNKPELGVFQLSKRDAARNFYVQLLAGDSTDNIKGLGAVPEKYITEYELHHSARKGCGLISAVRLLENITEPSEMHQLVLEIYTEKHGGDNEEAWRDFIKQGQLLYLCRDLEPEKGTPEPWDGTCVWDTVEVSG